MGIHKEVIIGPYIEMTYTPENTVKITRGCPEHGVISDTDKAKFCSMCGTKLREVETKIKAHMNFYSLMKEIDPNEIYEDELLWVYVSEKKLILTSNKYGNIDACEVTPKYITTALQEFKEYHEDLIAILRERADTFDIKFGVIVDYR